MNAWATVTNSLAAWRKRGTNLSRRSSFWRKRIALFLAVVGPGLITSNVDNDAGGISTYSQAGAQFGYTLLWSLIPMTIALYVSEEMCARMGVVTGKGLSDLIREEFGFRSTFFVMVAALFVDLFNTVAEFSGVAEASEIMHVSRYLSVPLAAIAVWLLVVYGSYRIVEKIFLVACGFYLSYVLSAFLAKPDWMLAAHSLVVPSVHFNAPYLLMVTGLVGTTIAPWQFFYLQAGFVEKRVGPRQYKHARMDVLVGSISCMIIVFFIIVCCAATLNVHGLTNISSAKDAAQALVPSGREVGWRPFRFRPSERVALRSFDPSAFHRARDLRRIGFRSRSRPQIQRSSRLLFAVHRTHRGRRGIVLIPKAPLWKILIYSQVGNGIWLPVVLIFILVLINRRDLMGDHVNTLAFNVIAWTASIIMIILTLVLIYTSIVPQAGSEAGAFIHRHFF